MAAYRYKLYGAILGDLAGQPYEGQLSPNMGNFNIHNPDSHITDDTIMTLATAQAVIENAMGSKAYMHYYKKWYRLYPNHGYGKMFKAWASHKEDKFGRSYGNGCLMRLSPFYWQKDKEWQEIELDAMLSCFTSHMDAESAVAVGTLSHLWGRLHKGVMFLGPNVPLKPLEEFSCTAEDTIKFVLESLPSTSKTHLAITNAVSRGGDTDTHASILGEIANFRRRDISVVDAEYVHSKLTLHQRNTLIQYNNLF